MAKKIINRVTNQVQAEPVGQAAADQSKLEQQALEKAELNKNGAADQGATQTTGEPIQAADLVDQAGTEGNDDPSPATKPGKKTIKKVNSKQDVNRQPETINTPETNAGNPVSADPVDRQLNTEEAVAYCMTTPEPMRAAKGLAAQRKLVNVTGVYAALEELGHK